MVGDAADEDPGAVEASGSFSEESVQPGAESEVAEEWATLFGREDEVDVGCGEGLGHVLVGVFVNGVFCGTPLGFGIFFLTLYPG